MSDSQRCGQELKKEFGSQTSVFLYFTLLVVLLAK